VESSCAPAAVRVVCTAIDKGQGPVEPRRGVQWWAGYVATLATPGPGRLAAPPPLGRPGPRPLQLRPGTVMPAPLPSKVAVIAGGS
jgi:hypothetical protein